MSFVRPLLIKVFSRSTRKSNWGSADSKVNGNVRWKLHRDKRNSDHSQHPVQTYGKPSCTLCFVDFIDFPIGTVPLLENKATTMKALVLIGSGLLIASILSIASTKALPITKDCHTLVN